MSLFESASLVVTPNGTKASKLYSVKPTDGSGDMTVVRATTATRVNSSGVIESSAINVPRLDYKDSTCPSLLVEPQRTNVFVRSEEFDNAIWIKTNATITANSVISPDGTQDADTYSVTSTGTTLVNQNLTLTTGAFAISVFAKKNNSNIIRIFNASSSTSAAWFDLNSGQVIGTVNGGTASIENYGNGWYRCIYRGTAVTSGFSGIGLSDSANTTTATAGSSVYVWGAQIESGSYATSYIPTTAASVTRNADIINKTGISSLIGQTEGTMFWYGYIDKNKSNYGYFPRLVAIGDGTTTNFSCLLLNGSNVLQTRFQISAIDQATISYTIPASGFYKIAFVYKQNDFALYVNGTSVGTDTSGNIIGFPNFYIGRELSDTTGINVTPPSQDSKLIALWKTRLTNTELATLTTL
jgi:hypothetical protein